MTLIIGFALVAGCWVWFAYGHDIAETFRAVRHLLTEAPPERVERHPWMRAMDELGRQ